MPHVDVHPFSRQPEGGEVVIGLPERGVFLALPPDAVEVLDLLADGHSTEEARAIHRRRYGEEADVDGLVEALAPHGFVHLRGAAPPAGGSPAAAAPAPRVLHFHFTAVPQRLAALLFGRAAVAGMLLVVAAGGAAWLERPHLLSGWRALVFDDAVTLQVLLLMLAALGSTFVHEMAHLVAARARGVDSRLGIGHRLWILVAETDLTGLWQVPRRRRYLPLLAGMLVDAVGLSLLLLALSAADRGWLPLAATGFRFVQAVAMVYALRLLWQAFFFVRTDLYYVYATACGCKDLMGDTRRLLSGLWARLGGRPPAAEPSHVPPREMRAVRAYAGFWLAGRLVALAVLFTVTLPVLAAYLVRIAADLAAGPAGGLAAYVESLVLALVSITFTAAGFLLWFRSWRRDRSSHHG
jgi:hypothetical protein